MDLTTPTPIEAEPLQSQLIALWGQALDIWVSGGWAMFAIALVALIMFMMGVNIWLRLQSKGFTRIKETTWRRWIDNKEERRGPIGELLDFVTGGKNLDDTQLFFEELRKTEIAPFDRDLKIMAVCVSVAPLLGLLGTVGGMLATFNALATGSGGDKTMGMVADGISVALITTETGLVIALPGLFFRYQLARKHDRYKAFLTHLETVVTQLLYRRMRGENVTVESIGHYEELPG